MNDDIHPTVDEYLETIGYLLEEGIPVIGARLAEKMGKSRPTVSEMLERLATAGLVARSGRQVRLTSEGEARSLAAIRRHRLAERLLVDVVGLPWWNVHAEAKRFATVLSPEIESRLLELLDDPATCPHGNPIPGSRRTPSAAAESHRLTEATVGDEVILARLSPELEGDGDSLRYLAASGFVPGVRAAVRERGPDGTLVLAVESGELGLGRGLGDLLYVVDARSGGDASAC